MANKYRLARKPVEELMTFGLDPIEETRVIEVLEVGDFLTIPNGKIERFRVVLLPDKAYCRVYYSVRSDKNTHAYVLKRAGHSHVLVRCRNR